MLRILRRFHNDQGGVELVELVVGGTILVAIMTLVVLSFWNQMKTDMNAARTIISDNVPTTAQQP
ncbi:MAG: hypothetical protein HY327_02740 [Chloroflexi bacterium]|nr:hypothetical protein [Chloroflexota bacterium]